MQRIQRLQTAMQEGELDALVCRLPENVLYLSDVWPHHGVSVAWLPAVGTPTLFTPAIEGPYADLGWADVVRFAWGLAGDPSEYTTLRRLLADVRNDLGPGTPRVGVERGFDVVGASYRVAEPVVPGSAWQEALHDGLAGASLIDASPLLAAARAVKGPYEIERIQASVAIAELGLAAGLARLVPGASEVEVAAEIERTIRARGPGHGGVRLARGTADVSAGPEGSAGAYLLIPSTERRLQQGDLVVIELATVADGYWSDLTYSATVGEPSEAQRERHNVVLAAQQAAIRAIRPGVRASDVDAAARSVITEAGLKEHFPHVTGHGLGFRYHEPTPMLAPTSEDVLRTGMVTSVEPGLYERGFGGIRIEDDVVVDDQGARLLSTPRTPW